MRKLLVLCMLMAIISIGLKAMADDVAQKTDGAFVGENPKPINSSFVGDTSSSVVNDSFAGEDVQKQTDGVFVGAGSTNAQNTYFAGDSYQQQVENSTVAPFAEDNSATPSDGTFLGQDTQKSTDGTFVGRNYGKND